jgi:sugar lactone lactonase YvrE
MAHVRHESSAVRIVLSTLRARRPASLITVAVSLAALLILSVGSLVLTRAHGAAAQHATASPRTLSPTSLAIGLHGEIYVSDTTANRVVELAPSGTILHTFGGSTQSATALNAPRGLAVDETGNVLVADSGSCRIVTLSATLQPRTTWPTCSPRSSGYDGPVALAPGPQGNLYLVSRGTPRIEILSRTGATVGWRNTLGSRIAYNAIAVDSKGTIYLTDPGNHRVVKLPPSGTAVEQWGQYGRGRGQFLRPTGIAVNRAGTVYVADPEAGRIQTFSSGGRLLATWGFHSTDATHRAAPGGIALDAQGVVYVTDFTRRIQQLSSNGRAVKVWNW